MHRLLLSVVLVLSSGWALAVDPTVECSGCATLRDFGNFGAAQLFRVTGTLSASVGNDRIWVVNSGTGQRVFVDVDTPFSFTSFMGFPIPIPDYTRMEINATRIDGSEFAAWTLPIEVIAAIAECIELAESDATPEVTADELPQLPGFDDAYVWQFIGAQGSLLSTDLLFNLWSFSLFYEGGYGTPLVTVYECAWSSAC